MAGDPPVSLERLRTYPTMTSWFRPDLLGKLLWRVIVSELFGQYADRRLIVAALDPVPKDELVNRASQFFPGTTFENPDDRPPTIFKPDSEGAVWIDFVADLGDGFDSTYAIASLLSQETLKVGEKMLPRGQLLIMGGDEVYPNADDTFYRERLINPYSWAFQDQHPGMLEGPPVYAIPGNHDWYDGLVLFLAFFTRRSPHLHLGGWRSWQRRSYFALQITEKWWIWAMDAQLDDDVDQPQKDYFDLIAKNMAPGSRIILCGPEPGWLYTLQQGNRSLSVVDNIAWSAINAKRGLKVPMVLSGDTHHYSRYSGNDGVSQFITSGGGGAFLHPTHQLEDVVNLDKATPNTTWLAGQVTRLNLKTTSSLPHRDCDQEACYPSKEESLELLKGNFGFVKLNPGFCILLGAIYWLAGLAAIHFWPDSMMVVSLVLCLGFWAYTKRQEGKSKKVTAVSVCNGLVHAALAILFATLFAWLNRGVPNFAGWQLPGILIFLAEMITAGALAGGYLFGMYLYVSSRFFNMNHNDAFSSMRLNTHRNFLRMRIKDEEITIYPVGLTDIPQREDWCINSEKKGCPSPAYVPVKDLVPHLIEGPIVVDASDMVAPTTST
jgi:Calcineurin-like phosphoesterase